MEIKDSGERTVHDSGAQRDMKEGKGRMDLLPMRALIELSKLLEQGAIKYGDRNWEKGIPLSSFLDSGQRHIANFMIGRTDEPHLVQAAWNILCAIDTLVRIKEGVLPESLNDLPRFEIIDDDKQFVNIKTVDQTSTIDIVRCPCCGKDHRFTKIKVGDGFTCSKCQTRFEIIADETGTGTETVTLSDFTQGTGDDKRLRCPSCSRLHAYCFMRVGDGFTCVTCKQRFEIIADNSPEDEIEAYPHMNKYIRYKHYDSSKLRSEIIQMLNDLESMKDDGK